jgi:hypothetical protein
MGIYAEVRDSVLAHRACTGPRQADAGVPTVVGYRLFVVCGCGAEFSRWVTPMVPTPGRRARPVNCFLVSAAVVGCATRSPPDPPADEARRWTTEAMRVVRTIEALDLTWSRA